MWNNLIENMEDSDNYPGFFFMELYRLCWL